MAALCRNQFTDLVFFFWDIMQRSTYRQFSASKHCAQRQIVRSSSYLTTGRVKQRGNTVGDRPNVPKRLDGCELNSHKRGQTCAHWCPPTLPHPLHSSNLHLVTQHTIQGLLLVDELLDEWVAFYRGCPSVLSSAKGRDANDDMEKSEHKLFF